MSLLLYGCQLHSPYQQRPSQNKDARVQYVILHYTSGSESSALEILTQPSLNPVSSHYLLGEQGAIWQLVPEQERAWHAGRSGWKLDSNLNNSSLGIELVNPSQCPEKNSCVFFPFQPAQLQQLLALARDLQQRYPAVKPQHWLGHQDIAPARKQDPGPLFPWHWLHQQGIGAWPDPSRVDAWLKQQPDLQSDLFFRALHCYGYPEVAAEPAAQAELVQAFHSHFYPSQRLAKASHQSQARLLALLEQYEPHCLQIYQQASVK